MYVIAIFKKICVLTLESLQYIRLSAVFCFVRFYCKSHLKDFPCVTHNIQLKHTIIKYKEKLKEQVDLYLTLFVNFVSEMNTSNKVG